MVVPRCDRNELRRSIGTRVPARRSATNARNGPARRARRGRPAEVGDRRSAMKRRQRLRPAAEKPVGASPGAEGLVPVPGRSPERQVRTCRFGALCLARAAASEIRSLAQCARALDEPARQPTRRLSPLRGRGEPGSSAPSGRSVSEQAVTPIEPGGPADPIAGHVSCPSCGGLAPSARTGFIEWATAATFLGRPVLSGRADEPGSLEW